VGVEEEKMIISMMIIMVNERNDRDICAHALPSMEQEEAGKIADLLYGKST
jgi:hypothetical protein